MKIDVIVPSNNIKELNGFIESFEKLKEFNTLCNLVIILNGNLISEDVYYNNTNITFIEHNKDYSNKIVPFLKLRLLGMINSDCDYFLFLDDDHRFNKNSDSFLIDCINLIKDLNDCSILCTDRFRDGKSGFHLKLDGFIWSSKGLFIKNILDKLDFNVNIIGAGEDLLLSYLVLNEEGLPYIYYGSDIKRKEKRHINGNYIENISYNKDVMDNGVLGFIRDLFDDKEWIHESYSRHINFPNVLQKKINERLNEKILSKMQ